VQIKVARTVLTTAPSERWAGFSMTIELGDCYGQFCLNDIEFGLDLAALGAVDSVAQLSPQFFDLDFEYVGHLRLLDVCER
jgi:hypothetical protein